MAEKGLSEQLEDCTNRCRAMDAPLAVRLQTFAEDVRRISPDFADIVDRMIARLTSVGTGTSAPAPGERMPPFLLPDQGGKLVSLEELLQSGPVVVAFHRGHWCPYCRINADALMAIAKDIRGKGAEVVAITPEIEKFNAEFATRTDDLRVLSDLENGYALLLNLAFFVGEEKRDAMMAAGWDITQFQGEGNWTLPIPATFVVGQDGVVIARFVDPDYRRRMDTDQILAALEG